MSFQLSPGAVASLAEFLRYVENHRTEVVVWETFDPRNNCDVYEVFVPNGPSFKFFAGENSDSQILPESLPDIRILKHGNSEGGWRGEITCTGSGNGNNGCGALLEVHEKALYNTYNHCRNETDRYVTVRCPHCQAETDVWGRCNDLIPYEVASRITKKGG